MTEVLESNPWAKTLADLLEGEGGRYIGEVGQANVYAVMAVAWELGLLRAVAEGIRTDMELERRRRA